MYINWKIQYRKDMICLKLMYVVLIKIPVDFLLLLFFFCTNGQTVSKIYVEIEKAKDGQDSLENEQN